MILRHFVSKDTYTENHSYRVSVYAAQIASQMGLNHDRIEDVRAAALLHDIGKLDISRELLQGRTIDGGGIRSRAAACGQGRRDAAPRRWLTAPHHSDHPRASR